MKKCTLDLVDKCPDGINEIRANIACFNREASDPRNTDRARNLLRYTTYWLYDEKTDAFGPSKFVGFKSMTFKRYNDYVENAIENNPGNFLGGNAREANEKTLGKRFDKNPNSSPSFANKLVEWGEKLFDTGIFKGTRQDKWRFINIPCTGSV